MIIRSSCLCLFLFVFMIVVLFVFFQTYLAVSGLGEFYPRVEQYLRHPDGNATEVSSSPALESKLAESEACYENTL